MTLELLLIRHAKSTWDDPTATDHDRTLNERGRRAASALGNWINQSALTPDEISCSTAIRARQTWGLIAAGVRDAPLATFDHDLYLANPARILKILRPSGGRRIAIVGHNPGLAICAGNLLADPPDTPEFFQYPSGAPTHIRFDIDRWTKNTPGTGSLLDFITPRTLATGR